MSSYDNLYKEMFPFELRMKCCDSNYLKDGYRYPYQTIKSRSLKGSSSKL